MGEYHPEMRIAHASRISRGDASLPTVLRACEPAVSGRCPTWVFTKR
jgi:hypothetical protein